MAEPIADRPIRVRKGAKGTGRAAGSLAMAQEALRAARRSLRLAERKYRGFFENAVEGVYQSTVEGKYLSVNPSLAALYGYRSPAVMMRSIGNIAQDIYAEPGMRQKFRKLIERDGEVRNLEYQVRRRDGSLIWISESARVVRSRARRVLYYEGTIRDITALKEAEAVSAKLEHQLRQAQKMEAIGTFASGIAHDFSNYNAAVAGFTELALDSTPEGSDAQFYQKEVLNVTRRAAELVKQILMFTLQAKPARKAIRLGKTIEDVARLVGATLPPKVKLVHELAAKDDEIIADPAQIHQVVLNLLANAVHSMRDAGGTLTVRLQAITLGKGESKAPGRYLLVSVEDSGHGIPEEVRERIFEPFFTTKPVGEGTGLGLSVVHGIVMGHGGEIQVSSTVGVGSTFKVFLPAN